MRDTHLQPTASTPRRVAMVTAMKTSLKRGRFVKKVTTPTPGPTLGRKTDAPSPKGVPMKGTKKAAVPLVASAAAKMEQMVSSMKGGRITQNKVQIEATYVEDSDNEPIVKKRPAAKGDSPGGKHSKDAYAAKDWRDRGKDKYIKHQIAKCKCPDFIADKLKSAGRTGSTEVINSIVEKNKAGQWQFKTDHPLFARCKQTFETEQNRARTVTKPTMMSESLWGGAEGLRRAVAAGQAVDNGDGTHSWNEGAHDNVKGTNRIDELKSTRKLTKEQFKIVDETMDKLGWTRIVATPSDTKNINLQLRTGDKLPRVVRSTVNDVHYCK